MEQSDLKNAFLEKVRQQIRCRKMQESLLEELSNHIEDQKDIYMEFGMTQEEALKKAVEQMGDPIQTGVELDRVHRPKTDWTLLLMTILLLSVGLGIQYCFQYGGGSTYEIDYFSKQAVICLAGMGVLAVVYFMDYSILGKFPLVIWAGITALCVFNIFFGVTVNGMNYYLSRLMPLFIPAFGGILYQYRGTGFRGIVSCGLYFAVPVLLSLYAGSISVLFLVCISGLIMLFSGIWKGWFGGERKKELMLVFFPLLVCSLLLIGLLYLRGGYYYMQRLLVFLDPSRDPMGAGYQMTVVREVLKNARLIGPASVVIDGTTISIDAFLPQVNIDMAVTYVIAHFGLLAGALVIGLFTAFFVKILRMSMKQKNALGFMVSLGCSLLIGLQGFFYISANLGRMIFGQIYLPFVSYGLTNCMVYMCLLGLILSVFRNTNIMPDKAEKSSKIPFSFIEYSEGRIVIRWKKRKGAEAAKEA